MSMERFLCIASPFGYTKLNQKTAKISLVLIWGLGLIMAIVPGLPQFLLHIIETKNKEKRKKRKDEKKDINVYFFR